MKISRTIEPEWLDELAPDDPRALRSRRDLRRINTLMMNAAVVARELTRGCSDNRRSVIGEIGAGDGTFMLSLAKKTAAPMQDACVVLLDRQDIVSRHTLAELGARGWRTRVVKADVFEWLARPADTVFDVLIANLFLHHFDDARLAELLSLAAPRTRVFVACEPRRSALGLAAGRMLGIIGCGDVSRHDAAVSVRAGFDRRELSALWPCSRTWILRERPYGLFSHCFVASRAHTDNIAAPPHAS